MENLGLGAVIAAGVVVAVVLLAMVHGKDMIETLDRFKIWSELNIENHDIETILLV